MSEFMKIRLIVEPPDGNPVEQLRMSPDELGRRPGRKTTIVTPVGARFFQICEPSLVRAFSYRDVIEAVPLGNDVWRFSRLVGRNAAATSPGVAQNRSFGLAPRVGVTSERFSGDHGRAPRRSGFNPWHYLRSWCASPERSGTARRSATDRCRPPLCLR